MNIDINRAIPSFPSIITEVNRLLESREGSYEKMASVIEKDPAICARLLKIVNSAFYGMPSQVSSISDAVSILGFDTVHRIALTISVLNSIGTDKRSDVFDEVKLWRHLFFTANISRAISMRFKMSNPSDAYIAGLLHDMGKFILYSHLPSYYEKVVEFSKAKGFPFHKVERMQKKYPTHCKLGAFAAKEWNFPKKLVNSIKFHHSETAPESDSLGTGLLFVANIIDKNKVMILNNNEKWKEYIPSWVMEDFKKVINSTDIWLPGVISESEKEFKLFSNVAVR